TPAARIASTQGGVFPVWRHGSRLTTSVPPRAWLPAVLSAVTSACGPPNSACHPSAMVLPFWSTTAPTMGLGATRPQPRNARSRARVIAAVSPATSEADTDADSTEDMSRLGVETLVVGRQRL